MSKSPSWDKPHGRIYATWMQLPAWREMSCFSRALLVELVTKYRPTTENLFALSDRQVADMLNCSRPTAAKTLTELEDRGWIEVERVGKMTGERAKRSSAYSLTTHARIIGESPLKTFERWRPYKPTAKNVTNNGQYLSQQRPKIEPFHDPEIPQKSPINH
ncbi:MAG: helix-turn-helix domain-containing protein [Hyphomicrobiales bacterium]|nr:helix-turn-helix domain-containing protein [Hyphomicrobiales bacterium]MDE2116205.1 helix-turn-helix domain-containing protein [Hyphomicrobiales bacterium]